VYLLVSGPTWDGDATATVYNGVVAVRTGQVDVFEPDKE